MTLESKPSSTVTVEGVPGRGASQDGAWTDPSQDGAWTEPFVDGAYTQDNAYEKEFKPASFFAVEGCPSGLFTAESIPTNTRTKEGVPA